MAPLARGGRAAQSFHVVCPSLPGYFSGKPTGPGWDIHRIARGWAVLMSRLGYDRFVAAGSDWGSSISTSLALQYPRRLFGIHLLAPLAAADREPSDELTDGERAALAELNERSSDGSGYSAVRSNPAADHRVRAQRLTVRTLRLDRGEALSPCRPRARSSEGGSATVSSLGGQAIRRHPLLGRTGTRWALRCLGATGGIRRRGQGRVPLHRRRWCESRRPTVNQRRMNSRSKIS